MSLESETLEQTFERHIQTPGGRRLLLRSMVRPIAELGTWGPDIVAKRPARARWLIRYLDRIRRAGLPGERFDPEPESLNFPAVPSLDEMYDQLEAWGGLERRTAWARLLYDD